MSHKRHRRAAASLDATRCAAILTMLDLANTSAVARRLSAIAGGGNSAAGRALHATADRAQAAADAVAVLADVLAAMEPRRFADALAPRWWRKIAARAGTPGAYVPVGPSDVEPNEVVYTDDPGATPAVYQRPVFLMPDL